MRESLLDAAADLLVERGYRAVRMRDVASAAGVSRRPSTTSSATSGAWRRRS
ncbi:helix-turn-helix domain-containing protein [Actinomadura luteofluorescens]|uniref:helix-turn-helix domain-containing protein n=1 Tax=Actinomadura luteofluorescens TaxID=46163 RepID=UPI00364016AC